RLPAARSAEPASPHGSLILHEARHHPGARAGRLQRCTVLAPSRGPGLSLPLLVPALAGRRLRRGVRHAGRPPVAGALRHALPALSRLHPPLFPPERDARAALPAADGSGPRRARTAWPHELREPGG